MKICLVINGYFFYFFIFLFFFDFLFYLGVHSSVITCSPMKLRAGMYQQFDCRDGFSLLICSERHISNGR